MANIEKRSNGVWRARYCDDAGKQHKRHFPQQGRGQGVDRHGHGLSRAGQLNGSEDGQDDRRAVVRNVAQGLRDAPRLDSARGAGAHWAD